MKDIAETNDLLKKPRKTLISSYHAKEILLTTPLLKWYLEHGLEVTRVHSFLEFEKAEPLFEDRGPEVVERRRQADVDPALATFAILMKLLGNS